MEYDDMTMTQLPDINQLSVPTPRDPGSPEVLYDIVSALDTYAPVFTAPTKKIMAEELGAYAAALAADLLGLPHGRVTAYVQDVPSSH